MSTSKRRFIFQEIPQTETVRRMHWYVSAIIVRRFDLHISKELEDKNTVQ